MTELVNALTPTVCKDSSILLVYAYSQGMASLEPYLDIQHSRGRSYFGKEEACEMLAMSSDSFSAAAASLAKKRRLVSPKRGFYLILRPEDWVAGAPDPVRWIDPLMNYLKLDYRISLLRAAAFHGASHQAGMVFQVIVPKQLRALTVGRHRIQFISNRRLSLTKSINRNGLIK